MVQFPVGVSGWVTFTFGLLIILYRLHGIDAPREWIEWTERRFTNTRLLQFIGGFLLLIVLILLKLGNTPTGIIGWLYIISMTSLFVLSICMILAINHLRLLVIATAQADDKYIRGVSIALVILGLLWALAPWFL